MLALRLIALLMLLSPGAHAAGCDDAGKVFDEVLEEFLRPDRRLAVMDQARSAPVVSRNGARSIGEEAIAPTALQRGQTVVVRRNDGTYSRGTATGTGSIDLGQGPDGGRFGKSASRGTYITGAMDPALFDANGVMALGTEVSFKTQAGYNRLAKFAGVDRETGFAVVETADGQVYRINPLELKAAKAETIDRASAAAKAADADAPTAVIRRPAARAPAVKAGEVYEDASAEKYFRSSFGGDAQGNLRAPSGRVSASTDIGPKTGKTKVNEDSLAIGAGPQGELNIILADGMGGHGAGEVASNLAVTHLQGAGRRGESLLESAKQIPSRLEAHVAEQVNAGASAVADDMNTTLLAARIKGDSLEAVWAGDSKLLIGRSGKIQYETPADSITDQMVRDGTITHEQRFNHPLKAVVSNSVGVSGGKALNVDMHHVVQELKPGDIVILASDGLYDVMTPQQAIDFVTRAKSAGLSLEEARVGLRREIDRLIRDLGRKKDNVTIAVYEHGS